MERVLKTQEDDDSEELQQIALRSLKDLSRSKTRDFDEPKSKSSIFIKSPLSSLEEKKSQKVVRLTKEEFKQQMQQVTENET